jgi:hypothetical protein
LECTDAIIVFEEDTPMELLALILPDVLVKGANYTLDQVTGRELVEENRRQKDRKTSSVAAWLKAVRGDHRETSPVPFPFDPEGGNGNACWTMAAGRGDAGIFSL